MDRTPILIGVLHDFPAPDGGAGFEWAARLGIDEGASAGRLPGPVEVVHLNAPGLPFPGGSAHGVEQAFYQLAEQGVLAVLGPAVSDNAIVVRPLADAVGLPT